MENKNKYYKCPKCGYGRVEIILASYTCDICKKRTSVYDTKERALYIFPQNDKEG